MAEGSGHVRALVSAGRLAAARAMVDTVTVTRPTRGALNTTTGLHASTSTTVYTGPARIRRATSSDATVGEREVQRSRPILSLPVGATGAADLRKGDVVTVTSSLNPDLASRTFTVGGLEVGTTATVHRYVVEEVSA